MSQNLNYEKENTCTIIWRHQATIRSGQTLKKNGNGWEKTNNPDRIIFTKVGGFYEFFHEDADIIHTVIDAPYMFGHVAWTGIPKSALESVQNKLKEAGWKDICAFLTYINKSYLWKHGSCNRMFLADTEDMKFLIEYFNETGIVVKDDEVGKQMKLV